MKFKHLLFSNRSLTKKAKTYRNLHSDSSFIYRNAPTTSYSSPSSSTLQNLIRFKTPNFITNPKSNTPISLFNRKVHSAIITTPVDEEVESDDEEEEDGPMTEFLSRFVWIMRSKLAQAYPSCDKQSINGMLLIIVEKVVEELEKGGIDEMLDAASSSPTYDFSEDLWKTVWEVSISVLDDMKKARKKEEMKKYIQSEEVKEMCRFASEVGIRGNMLREFRFKWAREKMEEDEFYQNLARMREEAHAQEREEQQRQQQEEMNGSENLSEEGGRDVVVKPKVVSLPQRRGKIKYKIYGLDLSDPKWRDVADKVHESWKVTSPEGPKEITGKCKLITEKIVSLKEADVASNILDLLAEWAELLEPGRVDWVALLERLRESNSGLYLKVAELVLDEDSFQANIRDYTKLIDTHAKDNHIDDVERFLKKMIGKGIQPDFLTSTILVHMYGKAGNIVLAKEAFERLRTQGIRPDIKIYTSMLMAYVKAGEPKLAESLMREMDTRGIKLTEETYMALLRLFSEHGLVDSAYRLSTFMEFEGFQPTLESSTLLVEAFSKVGNERRAKQHFDAMIKYGIKPDDRCAASLISVYQKQNLLDKALDVLLELETGGFEPGVATYTVLVDWFSQLQLTDEAEELVRKIKERDDTPLKVQVSLCDMYSRSKDEKKALQALGIVEGKKNLLGNDDFERLINGLVVGGLQKDALRVHGMMEARGFKASESLMVTLTASHAFRVQRTMTR